MITVLVIEDDEIIASLVQDVLEGEGYRVLMASDGISGLASARKYLPALILSNISLPGMDGPEVARVLKADARTSYIPVVLMSAAGEPLDSSFHNAFVQKPFTIDVLTNTVSRHIASVAHQLAPD